MKKTYLCSLAICLLLTLAFTTQALSVDALPQAITKALTEIQKRPTPPAGIKHYEGVLKEEATSGPYNVEIDVDFDKETAFVYLWNESYVVLDNVSLDITQAKNKTTGWGFHMVFKAVSADKETKLTVNQLKQFILCHITLTGTAYNGRITEVAE